MYRSFWRRVDKDPSNRVSVRFRWRDSTCRTESKPWGNLQQSKKEKTRKLNTNQLIIVVDAHRSILFVQHFRSSLSDISIVALTKEKCYIYKSVYHQHEILSPWNYTLDMQITHETTSCEQLSCLTSSVFGGGISSYAQSEHQNSWKKHAPWLYRTIRALREIRDLLTRWLTTVATTSCWLKPILHTAAAGAACIK